MSDREGKRPDGEEGDRASDEEGRPPDEAGDDREEPSLVADEPPPDAELEREHDRRHRSSALLGLFALGVVYGDIGTSPIYAFRESFHGNDPVPVSAANALGLLSLIFWSLVVVISLKYLFYIMRAENDGEGGILALSALLDPWQERRRVVTFLGLFGAALLYGDGMITPAISVLSAVEGLQVAAPGMERWVVPIAVVILILLFVFQRRGTTGVGSVFGPVMAVWFVTIAVLGVVEILKEPGVLAAVSPVHAVGFFGENGWTGFLVLGAVFLVVTGGEAMYADLGHFGTRPIRLGWFCVVLPALLLNYFGQGALVMSGGGGAEQPFYEMAPGWGLYPLVGLATAATVIASQAVITGVFSLTRQAIQLGQSPRFRVEQTSSEDIGRVYLPAVNWIMMVATIGLVLGFRSSSGLAAAYGVAVSTTFVITTMLAFYVAREKWGWNALAAGGVTAAFLAVDLAFFGANMTKIAEGGWFPLVVAVVVWFLMATWSRGQRLLARRLEEAVEPLDEVLEALAGGEIPRVRGTAVFLTREKEELPPILRHHLEHNGVLHETAVVLTVLTSNVPRVPFEKRLEAEEIGAGIYRALAHYGFMQSPNVPVLVDGLRRGGLPVEDDEGVTYYVGRETPVAVSEVGMAAWRARLFALMVRNSPREDRTYGIPRGQVVELGIQVEI